MVSFKPFRGGGKTSSSGGADIPCSASKKGPSLVDLQIHEGEFEDLFAIEAMIATLESVDWGDTLYNSGVAAKITAANATAKNKKTARRFFRLPKFAAANKNAAATETREAIDDWESEEFGSYDDDDDETLAVDFPFRDDDGDNGDRDGPSGDDDNKTWLSNVIDEGVKIASATFHTTASRKDAETVDGLDDDDEGYEVRIVNSKEMREKKAKQDENQLFLWEKTKILADAALRSGNFIAALEMYLVSRELIARHMEGGELHGYHNNADDAATANFQSDNHYTSKLMRITWIEAEILHGTGEVFYYLSKDAAPSEIDIARGKNNKERSKEETRHRQILDEAKTHLLDSLVAKQEIMCNAEILANGDAKQCVGLTFNPYTKNEPERIKMELSIASTLRLLGNTNTELGIMDDAKAQLRDARNIHLRTLIDIRSMGDACDPIMQWENTFGLALISYSCGNYFTVLDEIDNALEAYNEALDMITAVPKVSKVMAAALCRASIIARCGNIMDFNIELRTKIGECQYRKDMWRDALLTISKTLNLLNQQLEEKQHATQDYAKAKGCDCVRMAHKISSRRIVFSQLYHVYVLCSKVYTSVDDHDEASKAREEAERVRQEVIREQSPEAADPASALAHILEHVGEHYKGLKNDRMAMKSYRVALELCGDNSKATSKHGPYLQKYWNTEGSDPDTECRVLQKVGKIQTSKNEYSAALAAYTRSISVRIQAASLNKKHQDMLSGDYFQNVLSQDNNGLVKRRIHISHHDRDFIRSLQGIEDIAVALESRRKASGKESSALAPEAPSVPEALFDMSETPFRNALDILVRAIANESVTTNTNQLKNIGAIVLYRIGMALWKKDKKLDHALASMIKSLEQTIDDQGCSNKKFGGSQSSINEDMSRVNKADILESVGGIHLELGNHEEAKLAIIGALQEQHLNIMRKDGDEEEKYVARWKVARLSMKAGVLHSATGQLDTAEQLLKNALNIVKRATASPQLETMSTGVKNKTNGEFFDALAADILHQLGLTLARKRDRPGALKAYQKAKSTLERVGKKPDHPKIRKIDQDIIDLDSDNGALVNDERSIEDTIDFAAVDMYDDNSSLSTSSSWNEYDRIADDLGCGVPRILGNFVDRCVVE